jgi:MFS family permease
VTNAATSAAPRRRFQAFGALQSANFRTFWLSLVAFVSANQVLQIILAWAVYDMTKDPLYLGLLGGVMSIPAIAVTFFGGVIADRLDRRQVLLLSMVLYSANIGALTLLSGLGILAPWHLLASGAVIGAVTGLDGPSRQAIIPNLIERKDLMNAIALFSAVWQGTRIVGPFLGGVMVETVGLTLSLAVVTAAFVLSGVLLLFVRVVQVRGATEGFLAQVTQGLGFIKRNPLFYNLIGMTFFNSFFGMSYIFLLPIFAADILDIGAAGLGLLMGASALGSLVGTLSVAAFGKERHRYALLLGGAVVFGGTLVLFAYLHLLPLPDLFSGVSILSIPLTGTVLLALAVLAVSGAANSAYMITIQAVLQGAVPDELRGRVMGVHGLTWSLMPLGGLQGGTIANFFGAPFAVALGGVAVVAYALLAVARPSFRQQVTEASASVPVGA